MDPPFRLSRPPHARLPPQTMVQRAARATHTPRVLRQVWEKNKSLSFGFTANSFSVPSLVSAPSVKAGIQLYMHTRAYASTFTTRENINLA